MTSEDKTNVNPAAAEVAAKPKRGRKRKVDVDTASGQALQGAVESHQVQESAQTLATETPLAATPPAQAEAPSAETAHTLTPAESASSPATTSLESVTTGSGCGNVLKAAREAQGLSIHDVCSQLRLGLKQIQAIEQDDFDKLPQPSIVRGFIRNYARMLRIDPAPVLEAYQRIVPNKHPLPLSVRSNATPSVIDQPPRSTPSQKLVTLLIFLVLSAIGAYFYLNHIKPHALKDATLTPAAETQEAPADQTLEMPAPAATPPADVAPALPAPIDGQNPATDAAATSQPATTGESLPLPSAPVDNTVVSTQTPAATAAESTTIKAADAQKATLVFKATEATWVRIKDAQGKKVFSETLPAGAERQVVADKPVNITVGHASGTQLTIDNQPYDLTQATRGRVARIQLK